jgi:hypothetical protein
MSPQPPCGGQIQVEQGPQRDTAGCGPSTGIAKPRQVAARHAVPGGDGDQNHRQEVGQQPDVDTAGILGGRGCDGLDRRLGTDVPARPAFGGRQVN